jgi:hypothetical protein
MTQRRIFAFLWPDPPQGPVDSQARQARYLRINGRGPLRLALLFSLSLLTFGVGLIGSLVVVSSPTIPALALLGATLAALVPFLMRCWQVGTYVNDHGVRVITLRRTIRVPWTDVTWIESNGRGIRLGTPSESVVTHIAPHGLDYIARPEAYAIAVDRLENWWQQR